MMRQDFNEWQKNKVRSAVFKALADISNELDASEEDMEQAIEHFMIDYYIDGITE